MFQEFFTIESAGKQTEASETRRAVTRAMRLLAWVIWLGKLSVNAPRIAVNG